MKSAVLFLALLLAAAPAFAIEDDIPEDLRKADYITAVDVEAEVPYGELFIDEAVIAIFPRLEDRLSGMFIGGARLNFRKLPLSEAQPTAVENGRARFRVDSAYLAAS